MRPGPFDRPHGDDTAEYVDVPRSQALLLPDFGTKTATENYGFDRHVWDVRPELIVPGRKLVIVNEILFVVSTGLIKMSVLLFYRRIVDRSISRTFIIINWTCIATFAASIVIFLFLPFVACTPLSAFWDQVNPALRKNMYPHKCVNEGAHLLAATIISCIQDFIATTIPASLWRKITLPTRQKVALAGVFAIGYSGCVIAVLRTYYIWKIFYGTWDVTWVTWIGWLLTIIEATMAAICASLPALRVIFRRFLGATVASASNSLGRTPSRSWRSLKAWVAPRSQSGYANQLGGDGGSGIAGGDLGSRSQIVMQKEITIASSTELNDYPTDEESQRRPEDLPTNRPQPGEAF